MRPLDRYETLALQAALLPRDEAVLAWRELVAQVPWMEFPDPVERCLASIAVNLGAHSRHESDSSEEVPYSAKLAGVYRATWTANIMRLRGLSPVFDAFDHQGIDYRVLKGTALCASTDRWGTRRMGDIDVIVSSDQGARSVSVLRSLNFSPTYFRVIDDSDPPSDSSWEGPHGHIIDLHVANPERRSPELLDVLLSEQPSKTTSQGRTWPVPSPEALIVHSAMHARKGSAVSDHIQSLIDISLLLPLADSDRLRSLARRVRVTHPLSFLLEEISRITNSTSSTPAIEEWRAEPFIVSIRQFFTRATTFERVRRERVTTRPALDNTNVRHTLYRIWFQTGQMRPLERIICRAFGGFLRSGESDLPRDRRRHIAVPHSLRGRCIRVEVDCGDAYERLIFVNGIKFGTIEKKLTITLDHAPKSLEISLRLLGEPPQTALSPITVTISEVTGMLTTP
jgi:hypothetical protein